MPRELVDLDIEEISAVDHPANKRTFLIIKRAAVAKQGERELRALTPAMDAPISEGEWNGPDEVAAMDVEQLRRSTLLVNGNPDSKAAYKLPYRDRQGRINTQAVRNIQSRLAQTNMPSSIRSQVRANAQKLMDMIRENLQKMGAYTVDELLMYDEMMEHWWELWRAFQGSVESIMCDDEVDRPALLRQTVEEFAARVQDLLPMMADTSGDLMKAATETLQAIVGNLTALESVTRQEKFAVKKWQQNWTTLGTLVTQLPIQKEATMPTMPTVEELLKQAPKDIQEAFAARDTEIATLKAEVEALKHPPTEEDIWKGVSPVIKARMEELEKQTKAAEAAAAFEKAERIKKECMAEAATFRNLTISADDHWPLFKSIREMPNDLGAKVIEILRAADEAVKLGKSFRAPGSGSASMEVGTTAKVEALVKAKQQDNTQLSYFDALSKVFAENPSLYEQYREETQIVSNGRGSRREED